MTPNFDDGEPWCHTCQNCRERRCEGCHERVVAAVFAKLTAATGRLEALERAVREAIDTLRPAHWEPAWIRCEKVADSLERAITPATESTKEGAEDNGE